MMMLRDEQVEEITWARWLWVGHYAVGILIALLLGAVLGSLPLFHQSLFPSKLRASDLVSFMAYGGALLMFWLVGQRAAAQLEQEKTLVFLRPLIMPVVHLIVLTVGYMVLLLVIGPFLDQTAKSFYNWIFIVGIVGASLWLTLAWLRQSVPLLESMVRAPVADLRVSCLRCNALLINPGKFCEECGARLPRSSAQF
jgi:hypothetical protein